MALELYIKSFDELTGTEVFDLLQLRQEVFVVEQDCPYLDADDKDKVSHHVLGYDTAGTLVACTRIVPKAVSYKDYISIGRVVSKSTVRKTGAGKKIMQYTIAQCHELYGAAPIKISAQVYILDFYKGLGFEVVGEEYLEDDIPHMAMILRV